MNKGKLIKLSFCLFLFFMVFLGVFLLSLLSFYDFFNAADVISLSYSSTLCLSGIILGYFFLSLLYNIITQIIMKKPKKYFLSKNRHVYCYLVFFIFPYYLDRRLLPNI